MKLFLLISSLFVIISCATTGDKTTWVSESDEIAKAFTLEFAELSPEMGSGFGYKRFDKKGSQPSAKMEQKKQGKIKEMAEAPQ